jgi:hypothetical protein
MGNRCCEALGIAVVYVSPAMSHRSATASRSLGFAISILEMEWLALRTRRSSGAGVRATGHRTDTTAGNLKEVGEHDDSDNRHENPPLEP